MPQVPQTELKATKTPEGDTVKEHPETLDLPSVPLEDLREQGHDGERESPPDRERSSPMLAE